MSSNYCPGHIGESANKYNGWFQNDAKLLQAAWNDVKLPLHLLACHEHNKRGCCRSRFLVTWKNKQFVACSTLSNHSIVENMFRNAILRTQAEIQRWHSNDCTRGLEQRHCIGLSIHRTSSCTAWCCDPWKLLLALYTHKTTGYCASSYVKPRNNPTAPGGSSPRLYNFPKGNSHGGVHQVTDTLTIGLQILDLRGVMGVLVRHTSCVLLDGTCSPGSSLTLRQIDQTYWSVLQEEVIWSANWPPLIRLC